MKSWSQMIYVLRDPLPLFRNTVLDCRDYLDICFVRAARSHHSQKYPQNIFFSLVVSGGIVMDGPPSARCVSV